MNTRFEIVDGVVYVEKRIYEDAQRLDNNISKLVGSPCVNLFRTQPRITTGVESVTIDYQFADEVLVEMDPTVFVEALRARYNYHVRGHLVVDTGDKKPKDMIINRY